MGLNIRPFHFWQPTDLPINPNKHICWLKAPAGLGKSALAQTIAEQCAERGILAASFFFLRGAGDRSRITQLIPTLAYQLSNHFPALKPLLLDLLHKEPGVLYQTLSLQFKKLIGQTFQSLQLPDKPQVIIIDGLDECRDKEMMGDFISILINHYHRQPLPFQVLITSRVEEHLRRKLESSMAQATIHPLALEASTGNHDIDVYLRSEFSIICQERSRLLGREEWPSPRDYEALVNKCAGSFIFASTLIRFIKDGKRTPREMLDSALKAHAGLDPLYSQVLEEVEDTNSFKTVLAAITVLNSPLSITSLSELLGISPQVITADLLQTQSIIIIPGDDDTPVQMLHTSLQEFLTDESRAVHWFIDSQIHHHSISQACFEIISKKPSGVIFESEAQQYACANIFQHLEQAWISTGNGATLFDQSIKEPLNPLLSRFLSGDTDTWFNTVVYQGTIIEDQTRCMEEVSSYLKVSSS